MFLSFKRDTGAHSYHSAPAGSYSPGGSCLTHTGGTQQILLPPANTTMQLCSGPLGKKEKLSKIKGNFFYHGFVVKVVHINGEHQETRLDDSNYPTQFESLYLRCSSKNKHFGMRALTSTLKDRQSHKVFSSSQKTHHSPPKQHEYDQLGLISGEVLCQLRILRYRRKTYWHISVVTTVESSQVRVLSAAPKIPELNKNKDKQDLENSKTEFTCCEIFLPTFELFFISLGCIWLWKRAHPFCINYER